MQTIEIYCSIQAGIQLCMSWICPGGCTCIPTPYLIRKLDEECPPGQCGSRNLALIALIALEITQFVVNLFFLVVGLKDAGIIW